MGGRFSTLSIEELQGIWIRAGQEENRRLNAKFLLQKPLTENEFVLFWRLVVEKAADSRSGGNNGSSTTKDEKRPNEPTSLCDEAFARDLYRHAPSAVIWANFAAAWRARNDLQEGGYPALPWIE
ncbi:unnamed protein product [Amoebophrya sp. A25]|nr:unnamed protein product [Amoebophrya sp. A25]|eukprot:GSA25T00004121001.1